MKPLDIKDDVGQLATVAVVVRSSAWNTAEQEVYVYPTSRLARALSREAFQYAILTDQSYLSSKTDLMTYTTMDKLPIVSQSFLTAIERERYANRVVQLPAKPCPIGNIPLLGSLLSSCHSESPSANGAGALPFVSP